MNGSWLLDENGQKVKAVGLDGQNGTAGKTPELKIEEGKWFVSYDGGASWLELGKSSGPLGP